MWTLCEQDVGQDVTIMGWADTRRDLGAIVFIDLRDRSGIVRSACLIRRRSQMILPRW